MAKDVERAEVVNSKDRERLPRTPPPRRRRTKMNRGRKSEDIVKGMLTAVRKIEILYVCQTRLQAIKPCWAMWPQI